MPEPKALLWCDLETTGTDERTNAIIEIGLIVTTPALIEVASLSLLVNPRPRHDPAQWDPFITNMHTTNGLLGELEHGANVLSLLEADEAVDAFLGEMYSQHGYRPHSWLLAGSGVSHFDRRFIKAQLPKMESWLQYPNLDVGSTRREMQILGYGDLIPPFNDGKTHRAMDDVRCHLEEFRARRSMYADAARVRAARQIDVVFDGPPSAVSGRFVEVEDAETHASLGVGRWIDRGDMMEQSLGWALRLTVLPDSAAPSVE